MGLPVALPRMSQSAMSMPLMALMTAPRRPNVAVCAYIRFHNALIRSGSRPTISCFSPCTESWETGASMIAFRTKGEVCASPMPVIPSSVWMRMTRTSWRPSPSACTLGNLSMMVSTSVIFMFEDSLAHVRDSNAATRRARSIRKGMVPSTENRRRLHNPAGAGQSRSPLHRRHPRVEGLAKRPVGARHGTHLLRNRVLAIP